MEWACLFIVVGMVAAPVLWMVVWNNQRRPDQREMERLLSELVGLERRMLQVERLQAEVVSLEQRLFGLEKRLGEGAAPTLVAPSETVLDTPPNAVVPAKPAVPRESPAAVKPPLETRPMEPPPPLAASNASPEPSEPAAPAPVVSEPLAVEPLEPSTPVPAAPGRKPIDQLLSRLNQQRGANLPANHTSTVGSASTEPERSIPSAVPTVDHQPSPESAPSLEERIGVTWFTRIGAFVLVLGIAWFYKFAVDQSWIGPWARVATGALFGFATLAGSELAKKRTQPAWVQVFAGLGVAILYLSGYASYAWYGLISTPVASVVMVALTCLGGAVALRHRSEILFGIAVGTAFANPLLLSTGTDHPVALFGYLLFLSALTLGTSLKQGFRWIPWVSFVGVAMLTAGWALRYGYSGAYDWWATRLGPAGLIAGIGVTWLAFGRVRERTTLVDAAAWRDASTFYLLFPAVLFWADTPLALAGVIAAMFAVGTWNLRSLPSLLQPAMVLGLGGLAAIGLAVDGSPLAFGILAAASLAWVAISPLWMNAIHAHAVQWIPERLLEPAAIAVLPGLAFSWWALGFWDREPVIGLAFIAAWALVTTLRWRGLSGWLGAANGIAAFVIATVWYVPAPEPRYLPWFALAMCLATVAFPIFWLRRSMPEELQALGKPYGIPGVELLTGLAVVPVAAAWFHGAAPLDPLWAAGGLAAVGLALGGATTLVWTVPAALWLLGMNHPWSAAVQAELLGITFVGSALASFRTVREPQRWALEAGSDLLLTAIGVAAVLFLPGLSNPVQAAAIAAFGVRHLGVAWKANPPLPEVSALLGIGLLAVAVPVGFDGVSVTAFYAVLALGTAGIGLRSSRSSLVFAAAVLLLGTWLSGVADLDWPQRARELHLVSGGTHGQYPVRFLLQPRGVGGGIAGAALLAFAWLLQRTPPKALDAVALTWVTGAIAAMGHAWLLLIGILEVQDLVTAWPTIADTWVVEAALRASASERSLTITLGLALYGVGLLGVGFWRDQLSRRWFGLVLLAGAIGKAFLNDVFLLGSLERIIAFIALGVMLLGIGFAYARWGKRWFAVRKPNGTTP